MSEQANKKPEVLDLLGGNKKKKAAPAAKPAEKAAEPKTAPKAAAPKAADKKNSRQPALDLLSPKKAVKKQFFSF